MDDSDEEGDDDMEEVDEDEDVPPSTSRVPYPHLLVSNASVPGCLIVSDSCLCVYLWI